MKKLGLKCVAFFHKSCKSEFKIYTTDNDGKLKIKKLYLDPFLDMFNGEVL